MAYSLKKKKKRCTRNLRPWFLSMEKICFCCCFFYLTFTFKLFHILFKVSLSMVVYNLNYCWNNLTVKSHLYDSVHQ